MKYLFSVLILGLLISSCTNDSYTAGPVQEKPVADEVQEINLSSVIAELGEEKIAAILAEAPANPAAKQKFNTARNLSALEDAFEDRLQNYADMLPDVQQNQPTGQNPPTQQGPTGAPDFISPIDCDDFVDRVRIRTSWVSFPSHLPQNALAGLVDEIAIANDQFPNCDGITVQRVIVRQQGQDNLRVRAIIMIETFLP